MNIDAQLEVLALLLFNVSVVFISCATGNLKLLQVSDDGAYVRVSNTSASQDELVGGFMLQQNVGGHPVAVFRFPPRARIPAASSATVWSAKAINGVHDPPSHYIWSQLDKWGTGPECTTVLCKPNGQAVAWITSAPISRHQYRATQGFKYEPDVKQRTEETQRLMEELRVRNQQLEQEDAMSEEDANQEDGWRPEQMRKPISYSAKPTLYGDRPYSPKPNPVIRRPLSSPSALHLKTTVTAGGLPSRTGSAPLQLHHKPTSQVSPYTKSTEYHPPWSIYHDPAQDEIEPATIKSAPPKRNLSNWEAADREYLNSAPPGLQLLDQLTRKSPGQSTRLHLPGTFWAPAEQHKRGMDWIRSQQNLGFLPPMPKAFPCVTPTYRNAT